MLISVKIVNYKCYDNHTILFQPISVIVGKNNAGKSTLVEVLRLVSIITERSKGLNYKHINENLIPSRKAMIPSIEKLDLSIKNIFYVYGNEPAIIEAVFEHGLVLKIYILENFKVYAIYYDKYGNLIEKKDVYDKHQQKVGILPQVAPLLLNEKMLDPDYIKNTMTTNLSYQHFRNELYLFKEEYFDDFKKIVESSWPSVEVKLIESMTGDEGNGISLIIRENSFAAEIGWMGHGLQMWLQTMWFIARTKNYDTVILDEPDVYMHADLQKQLIRMIKGLYPQVIIATHSVEIIQEVIPENILILDRRNPISSSAKNFSAVQKLIEGLGTINNLQLSRLWYSKKCLLVEGYDLSFLKVLYDKIYEGDYIPLDSIPNMSIGGWSGWNYAIGSSMILRNAAGESIKVYCILDSDYHSTLEIEKRRKDAIDKGIILHIWEKKEIENYLISCSAIRRIIEKENDRAIVHTADIQKLIDNIIGEEKEDLVAKILDTISKEKKGIEPSSLLSESRKLVDEYEKNNELCDKISGKKILSKLSSICKSTYNVSFSAQRIAYEIRLDEIDKEVKYILEELSK